MKAVGEEKKTFQIKYEQVCADLKLLGLTMNPYKKRRIEVILLLNHAQMN